MREGRVPGHWKDEYVPFGRVLERVFDACRAAVLDAALGEIITTCSKLDWLINHGERVLSPEKRYNNLIMFYKSSYVYYEPLGVVSAIVSWNYRK